MKPYEKIAMNRRKLPLRILRRKALKAKSKSKLWTLEEIEYLKEYCRRGFYRRYGFMFTKEELAKKSRGESWSETYDRGW